MTDAVATCVWRVHPELLLALERFGEPMAYVNGAQVWLRDDGPGGIELEWRLHPVPGYRRPDGANTDEVFEHVVYGLRTGEGPDIDPASLWDGLEAFGCDGDDVEPAPLAAAVTASLGIAPEAFGIVDHEAIADRWERTLGRDVSITELLFEQLGPR